MCTHYRADSTYKPNKNGPKKTSLQNTRFCRKLSILWIGLVCFSFFLLFFVWSILLGSETTLDIELILQPIESENSKKLFLRKISLRFSNHHYQQCHFCYFFSRYQNETLQHERKSATLPQYSKIPKTIILTLNL